MLTREEASERLTKFIVKGSLARIDKALKEIDKPLRETARLFITPNQKTSQEDHLRWLVHMCNQVAALDQLADTARVTLFETMFPNLGRFVNAAWEKKQTGTYTSGYYRRAFRAPNNRQITGFARASWLEGLRVILTNYAGQDIQWVAQWTPYISFLNHSHYLGELLGAAIDCGGPEGDAVFDILLASARGEHEIGGMGNHVVVALLSCSRPEAWEFMEKLLLSAQREEGLRQTILESIDFAHPQAFRRMMHLILEHNLLRFSSAARAVDMWLGLQWDSASTGMLTEAVRKMLLFLENPQERQKALREGSAQDVFFALYAQGFEDTEEGVRVAAPLLKDSDIPRRVAAAWVISKYQLHQAQRELAKYVLPDTEPHVLSIALRALPAPELAEDLAMFDRLEELFKTMNSKRGAKLSSIVWPWLKLTLDRADVADAMRLYVPKDEPLRLLPYIEAMSIYTRQSVIGEFQERKLWKANTRDVLIRLLGDSSQGVREEALKAFSTSKITASEAEPLEALLTRKTADLRGGVISLLLTLPDEQALKSAERLLASRDEKQRLAGLEMLRQLVTTDRSVENCRAAAAEYASASTSLSEEEKGHLQAIRGEGISRDWTPENGLGLIDNDHRTSAMPVCSKIPEFVLPETVVFVRELDELIHQYRNFSVQTGTLECPSETLVSEMRRYDLSAYTLAERTEPAAVFETEFWQKCQATMQKITGNDFAAPLRAALLLEHWQKTQWEKTKYGRDEKAARKIAHSVLPDVRKLKLRYAVPIEVILEWLNFHSIDSTTIDFLLDCLETSLALQPEEALRSLPDPKNQKKKNSWQMEDPAEWREDFLISNFIDMINQWRKVKPSLFSVLMTARYWNLLHWIDEPVASDGTRLAAFERKRPDMDLLPTLYESGLVTRDDVLDQLIGNRVTWGWKSSYIELSQLTTRMPSPELQKHAWISTIVDDCIERILQVELPRGEAATMATSMAYSLNCLRGMNFLFRILAALGDYPLTRGRAWNPSEDKASVFSYLIRITVPAESDTPESFATIARENKLSEERLTEVAMFAPDWAPFVEAALGVPGFTDGIWWVHAHTKESNWGVDEFTRDIWTARVAERTSLTGDDLREGAVDVGWFNKVIEMLGEKRFSRMLEVAKYASDGTGHIRAKQFAEAMLGRIDRNELIERIEKKRHQDSVRSLGLLPLASRASARTEVLERYRILQEFLRTSKQFGSQRKASERRAVDIAMINLARTAGYPDPMRLQWAMEGKAVADLAKGPVIANVGEVSVSLAIDELGQAQVNCTKAGKELKAIPPAVKKDPNVAGLLERKTELGRQVTRVRRSLEEAMVRGDAFTTDELQELCRHGLLAPLLNNLVCVATTDKGSGKAAKAKAVFGYPVDGGKRLEDHTGNVQLISPQSEVRIAHAMDLLATGDWNHWQRDCFIRERVQPFKQVFRELYTLTRTERDDKDRISRRYAGHQVQPRQAVALLGQRGWVIHPEEGARRTFHDAQLSAHLVFEETFFTPAEVEGLTLEGLTFTRRGAAQTVPLEEVPGRLFSEVMRDLDLVVSVAHRSGVDPEASMSTIEMRAALVEETCRMLKLTNVQVKAPHVMISGKYGEYLVHLGSAVTHKRPGEAVFIVPVHAQHRGRLFLPFVDDDPRSAEVLSKTLLLARDGEIRDPNILEQIR